MSEIWNKVYKSDSTFFGEEPSNFAILCFNHMKANNAKKVLELGAGHGRDTTFFASNGIEVEALDYSVIAVELLDKIRKEKRLPIKPRIFVSRSRFRSQIDILMLYIHTCFST
jgi:2-polyprenyl-3-methyl-5-hydroxy-6-metoxy-1,4-benzoquinol methylase